MNEIVAGDGYGVAFPSQPLTSTKQDPESRPVYMTHVGEGYDDRVALPFVAQFIHEIVGVFDDERYTRAGRATQTTLRAMLRKQAAFSDIDVAV